MNLAACKSNVQMTGAQLVCIIITLVVHFATNNAGVDVL